MEIELNYAEHFKRMSEYLEYFLNEEKNTKKLVMEKDEYIKRLEQGLNETLGWNKYFKDENNRLKEILKKVCDLIEDKELIKRIEDESK